MEGLKQSQKSFGEYAAQAETLYRDKLELVADKLEKLDHEGLADDVVLSVELDNTSFKPDISDLSNDTYKETMSVRVLKDHLKNAYGDFSPEKWLESKQDSKFDDPKDLLEFYKSDLDIESFVIPHLWTKVE
ncbi:MAG: hypothetical protein V4524_00440 [Patescibacteria group bacterium]